MLYKVILTIDHLKILLKQHFPSVVFIDKVVLIVSVNFGWDLIDDHSNESY